MGKEIISKTVIAAAQEALKAFLPEFRTRMDDLKRDLTEIRRDLLLAQKELDDKIEMRFDQSRDAFNQLGERMAHVEGTIGGFTRAVERQSDKMDKWIERLVRVKMTQTARRGKRVS